MNFYQSFQINDELVTRNDDNYFNIEFSGYKIKLPIKKHNDNIFYYLLYIPNISLFKCHWLS